MAEASAVEGGAPSGVLAAVLAYLPTVVKDATAVDAFAKANQSAPLNSVLHNAAVFLTQHTAGNISKEISDLDTAVQMAYSLFKSKQAPAKAAA